MATRSLHYSKIPFGFVVPHTPCEHVPWLLVLQFRALARFQERSAQQTNEAEQHQPCLLSVVQSPCGHRAEHSSPALVVYLALRQILAAIRVFENHGERIAGGYWTRSCRAKAAVLSPNESPYGPDANARRSVASNPANENQKSHAPGTCARGLANTADRVHQRRACHLADTQA